MSEISALEFMKQQFTSAGIRYEEDPKNLCIVCVFHPNSGTKFKLTIDHSGKFGGCWACPFRGGYNKVVDKLREMGRELQKLPDDSDETYGSIRGSLDKLDKTHRVYRMPPGREPFEQEWRGLPPGFLAELKSELYWDSLSNCERIIWPVIFNGKPQGWVAGWIDPTTKIKYRNECDAIKTILFIDHPLITDTIVLTEGPYSSARLLYAGLGSGSILGVKNWSPQKLNMLQQRKVPITKLVLAFDGDDQGWEVTRRVMKDAKDRMDRIEIFECPDNKDPGNMNNKALAKLTMLYESLNPAPASSPIAVPIDDTTAPF